MISLKDQIKSLLVYNEKLGHILNIRVTPKASDNKIKIDTIIRVYITTTPENNKANESVIKMISKALDIAPSNISIINGMKTKNKTLAIQNYRG